MAKYLVTIFSYSMVSFFWRMSFICHLFFLFLSPSLLILFFSCLGSPSTCFVVLNFVYLSVLPLKVEFQWNLCYLFSLLLLDAFHEEKGEMLTWCCCFQTRSHPSCSPNFLFWKFKTTETWNCHNGIHLCLLFRSTNFQHFATFAFSVFVWLNHFENKL